MSDEQKRRRVEALYQKYHRKFPEVRSVTVGELLQLEQSGQALVLVDVRQPEEQAVSMIPGAIRSSEFEEHRDDFRGRLVVTYCTAGYRSGLYARELMREGWDVANLEGSLLAWTHAGQPLEDADGPTRRVHVYGPDWDLAASGYQPVW